MHARHLSAHGIPLSLFRLKDDVGEVLAAVITVRRHDANGKAVDVLEFRHLRRRRSSHATNARVPEEEALVRHACERDTLLLNLHALLRLHSLVQSIGPSASLHRTSGELVDNDHLVALDDVLHVALLQFLRLKCIQQVRRPLRSRVVKVAHAEHLLGSLVSLVGDEH